MLRSISFIRQFKLRQQRLQVRPTFIKLFLYGQNRSQNVKFVSLKIITAHCADNSILTHGIHNDKLVECIYFITSYVWGILNLNHATNQNQRKLTHYSIICIIHMISFLIQFKELRLIALSHHAVKRTNILGIRSRLKRLVLFLF